MLREILMMNQEKLFDYLLDKLKEFGYNDIKCPADKTYIAATGKIPIVLLAHLDTVFDKDEVPREKMLVCRDKEQGVWWSPHGLGTDDKAGVAMILSILKHTDLRPHILFTTNEETDGAGARTIAHHVMLDGSLFDDVRYFIQLDRQGYKECVFYQCDNKEFEKYVNSFGFHTEEGTYTDISVICPAWGIAGVNLSVGYFWEHTFMEHFFEYMWKDTLKRVVNMLEDDNKTIWKYIKKKEINYGRKGSTGKGRN